MRCKIYATVLSLVLLCLASIYSVSYTVKQVKSSYDLILSVYVDDELVYSHVSDTWLENYINITSGRMDEGIEHQVTDETGTKHDILGSGDPHIFRRSRWGDDDFKIAIGRSNTAVSKDDYALGSYYAKTAVSVPTLTYSGNMINLSFSAPFTFSETTTIYESGVLVEDFDNSIGQNKLDDLYLARDVFGAREVGIGNTLTITYTIAFNVT